MRHAVTLLVLICGFRTSAQIPSAGRTALVVKAAGTWCAGCGEWGWILQEQIVADQSGSNPTAVVLNAYSGATSFLNSAGAQLSGFAYAFPNWGINNVPEGPYSYPDSMQKQLFRRRIKQVADSFAATDPVASVGFTARITGRDIEIRTRTRFWQAARPDYYLAVYAIEDSLLAFQEGHPDSIALHNNVVRGNIAAATFGERISKLDIPRDALFDKTFRYTIVDSSWNTSHLHFVAAIWKMASGGNWHLENLSAIPSDPVSALSQKTAEAIFYIAPNPATDWIRLSFNRSPGAAVEILILNAIGQQVRRELIFHPSSALLSLDVAALPAGKYIVQATVAGGMLRPQALSIQR